MITLPENLLNKHAVGIQAAINYYVYSQPTGISDDEYDRLEYEAALDGISLRDYATQFLQGRRSPNAGYIGKVEKLQVSGDMLGAMVSFGRNSGVSFWEPKYDGSSVAVYYNPQTGKLQKVVTIGGSNLGGEGIDQTEKLGHFFPDLPGTGITAIQCECLVSLEKGLGEKSRQKANGLINASYTPLSETEYKGQAKYSKYLKDWEDNFLKVKNEIDDLLTFRCFRVFPPGPLSQKEILQSLPKVYNSSGDLKFSGAYIMEESELGDFVNSDIWKTPDGTFLVDGVVGYSYYGVCIKALKYKDAGRGEATEVLGIKWNDQSSKGKDSWSANAIISPVTIRGTSITKPTVGSISKMITSGLSKGAKVTIIMANSTIPQVSKVITPGNLDFQWPTCGCGYTIGPSDIYGALVKCGNPRCSEREKRMRNYLKTCQNFCDIDFNKLFILDRFDWKKKTDLKTVQSDVLQILYTGGSYQDFKSYLLGYMTTPLLRRNLELVSYPAYITLKEYVNQKFSDGNIQ